jgi:hypothetical protein
MKKKIKENLENIKSLFNDKILIEVIKKNCWNNSRRKILITKLFLILHPKKPKQKFKNNQEKIKKKFKVFQ